MDRIADLHTHTRCSDGALTPEELVALAKRSNISVLSVTDHDNVDGVCQAISHGKLLGVTVLSGIEMSVAWNQREIHILGYCFDPDNEEIQNCLDMFREQRIQRAERMVTKINAMNIPLKLESVLKQAQNGVVCRPHIASALLEQKFVASYSEVFQKYIGDWAPAYEKKAEFPLEKAIEVISNAGGLSFLAHPGNLFTHKEIFNIIKAGIDGIEVVHPSHTAEMQRFYRGITNEYYLLESGGSDFHGGLRSDERYFGQSGVSLQAVERMQQRLCRSAQKTFF